MGCAAARGTARRCTPTLSRCGVGLLLPTALHAAAVARAAATGLLRRSTPPGYLPPWAANNLRCFGGLRAASRAPPRAALRPSLASARGDANPGPPPVVGPGFARCPPPPGRPAPLCPRRSRPSVGGRAVPGDASPSSAFPLRGFAPPGAGGSPRVCGRGLRRSVAVAAFRVRRFFGPVLRRSGLRSPGRLFPAPAPAPGGRGRRLRRRW